MFCTKVLRVEPNSYDILVIVFDIIKRPVFGVESNSCNKLSFDFYFQYDCSGVLIQAAQSL